MLATLNGAINAALNGLLPFGRYRSAGFVVVFGACLCLAVLAMALWLRYCTRRGGRRARRHDTVRLLVWPSVVREPGPRVAAAQALLEDLTRTLAAELGQAVRVQVAAVVRHARADDVRAATEVSELASRCGLPVMLLHLEPAAARTRVAEGAWVGVVTVHTDKELARAVDAVVCCRDGDAELARPAWRGRKLWRL